MIKILEACEALAPLINEMAQKPARVLATPLRRLYAATEARLEYYLIAPLRHEANSSAVCLSQPLRLIAVSL